MYYVYELVHVLIFLAIVSDLILTVEIPHLNYEIVKEAVYNSRAHIECVWYNQRRLHGKNGRILDSVGKSIVLDLQIFQSSGQGWSVKMTSLRVNVAPFVRVCVARKFGRSRLESQYNE